MAIAEEPPMRTKRIRLGIAVAALSVIMGGPAVAATQITVAGADTPDRGQVVDTAWQTDATPVQGTQSLAGFDWL
jgi:hypothetical protein